MHEAQADEVLGRAQSRAGETYDLRGGWLSWQDKILNEPRLGFVKEHGSKLRPLKKG